MIKLKIVHKGRKALKYSKENIEELKKIIQDCKNTVEKLEKELKNTKDINKKIRDFVLECVPLN
ncbi:hypothetical protein [Spiroplasma endosymbiont of Zeiraphera isertana]|uniref:hypothetical protein n=1 Tax=Spiroplasma endosymbiont of Zeiraphera isertana TaxID=3066313 RepID=UPI00313E5124